MVDVDKDDFYVRLMHKDVEVAYMKVKRDREIKQVSFYDDAMDHIPLGGGLNVMRFHEGWEDRAVPKTRHGAKSALKRLGYASTGDMLVDNLAPVSDGLLLDQAGWYGYHMGRCKPV